DLDDLAGAISRRAGFLGEQQRFREWIERAAVNRAEAGGGPVTRCQQRNTVVQIRYVEIDACDVGLTAAVLVSLEEEVPSIVEGGARAAGVMIKHEVGILIWLGARRVAEHAEFGEDAERVLQWIIASRNYSRLEVGIDLCGRRAGRRICGRHAIFDPADSVSECRRRNKRQQRYESQSRW